MSISGPSGQSEKGFGRASQPDLGPRVEGNPPREKSRLARPGPGVSAGPTAPNP